MQPLPDNYQSLSAQQKLELLWGRIQSSEYPENELPQWGMPGFLWTALTNGLFSKTFLTKTLMTVSDEIPDGRKRLIHTYGTMSKVSFEARSGHPFTGIFESGAPCGLMRVSLTLPAKSFTPGFGVKFLVDGQPSRNIPVIQYMNGQHEDHNVFRRTGSNEVTPHQSKPLFLLLMLALKRTIRPLKPHTLSWHSIPLDAMSAVRCDGTPVKSPVVPRFVNFLPTPDAQLSRSSQPDYRLKLKSVIKPGMKLYEVVAAASEDATPVHVGTIRCEGEFVASVYGDKTIFFQHDTGVIDGRP